MADNTNPIVEMKTNKGTMRIELFEKDVPNTVHNWTSLIKKNFYDGLKFHRVIKGFMAQGGDPKGDGSGGPGYTIKCEIGPNKHLKGSLSMAHRGPDTGGSQFFICFEPQSHLDGKHTVFGKVIEGLDVLDKIEQGDKMEEVRVISGVPS
jgi:peptidyl-prolyl cis-trans isomerase B (cyclophilin B)